MQSHMLRAALAAAIGLGIATTASAQNFTYHGQLQDAGKAANGSYDLQLTLYSAAQGGSAIAGPITLYGVSVKDGSFVSEVNFGPTAPLMEQAWLEVSVKAGGGQFVKLDNRSPVAPEGTACPGSWTLDGNAGNPGGSYLGTADDQLVAIKANNTYGALIYPGSNVGLAWPYGPASGVTNSTAIGYNAGAMFSGSTVIGGFGDTTFGTSVRDTATNQVVIAAEHGVGINTGKAADGLALRDELTIAPSAGLPAGNADVSLITGTPGATGYHGFNINAQPNGYLNINGMYSATAGALVYGNVLQVNYVSSGYGLLGFNGASAVYPIHFGTNTSNGNGAYLSGTGVWTNASSRTFKDSFAAIDPVAVLEKLVALPVKTWYYKGNRGDGQHMGPVAEDFAAAFGLGSNEKYIGSVDESGVAFAAIQGLNRKFASENADLKARNAALQERLDQLASRLAKLEAQRGD